MEQLKLANSRTLEKLEEIEALNIRVPPRFRRRKLQKTPCCEGF